MQEADRGRSNLPWDTFPLVRVPPLPLRWSTNKLDVEIILRMSNEAVVRKTVKEELSVKTFYEVSLCSSAESTLERIITKRLS
jgi:hypothetical protein